jgi:uncharacterized protein
VIETLAPSMSRYPSAFGHLLGTADMLVNGGVELAIVGDVGSEEFVALERAASDRYVPSLVVAGGTSQGIALLEGREARDGRATAYVCRSYACEEPTDNPARLGEQLEAMTSNPRRDETPG